MTKTSAAGVVLAQNLLFWPLFLVATSGYAAVALVVVTVAGLCWCDRRRTLRLMRRAINHYGMTIIRCGRPWVRVDYHDHAPGERLPFVVVANHRSASDPFLMGLLPVELIQVVNKWPMRLPLLGMVARWAGYLDVRRMSAEDFLATGAELLRQGVTVVAFPEGTRHPGDMGPFHGIVFRLAQRAGVAIVPLVIVGNRRIPPKGSLVMHPGRVQLHKLPAFTPEQCAGLSPFVLKTRVREVIRTRLAELEESC